MKKIWHIFPTVVVFLKNSLLMWFFKLYFSTLNTQQTKKISRFLVRSCDTTIEYSCRAYHSKQSHESSHTHIYNQICASSSLRRSSLMTPQFEEGDKDREIFFSTSVVFVKNTNRGSFIKSRHILTSNTHVYWWRTKQFFVVWYYKDKKKKHKQLRRQNQNKTKKYWIDNFGNCVKH